MKPTLATVSLALASLTLSVQLTHAADCPITFKLDPKAHTLTNETLLKMNPKWPDPAQVSGFTRTDFDSIQPWTIEKCGAGFCAQPKPQTLQHEIHIRAEKLAGGKPNPRWIAIEKFPCGSKPHKNFVTYACTLEHEKVHVIQREDALTEACPAFVSELQKIQASSKKAAEAKARAAYQILVQKIAAADQEEVPYQLEWKCNAELAQKSGISCAKPDWSKIVGTSDYKEQSIEDSTQLTSKEAVGECVKKQWYFAGPTMDQENCYLENGTVRKTFYEFGQKQREILVDSKANKLSEKIYFNPKDRILKD